MINQTESRLPAGFVCRAVRMDDLGPIADFLNNCLRNTVGEHAHRHSIADLKSLINLPSAQLETDFRVVTHAEDGIVGFAHVEFTSPFDVMDVRCDVYPTDGGTPVADILFFWMESRIRDGNILSKTRPQVTLRTGFALAQTARKTMHESHGFTLSRHFHRMVIDLDGDFPKPQWPEGMDCRAYDPVLHESLLASAHIAAFQDHWGAQDLSIEEQAALIRAWTSDHPGFDPAFWFTVWKDDVIVGFNLCWGVEGDDHTRGHVAWLGVTPVARRMGLGKALMVHAFRVFKALGKTQVILGVDSDNATGAVELYEALGMRTVKRSAAFDKILCL